MRYLHLFFWAVGLAFLGTSCAGEKSAENSSTAPQPGSWRATLDVAPGVKLPFTFSVSTAAGQPLLAIHNGTDTLSISEVMMTGDSLIIPMPVYHAEIRARLTDSTMSGQFHNYYRGPDYTIPFHAKHGVTYRFPPASRPTTSVAGRWEVWFGTDSTDLDQAIGVFEQRGHALTGTFLTPYGDYRYLAGQVSADSLWLSNFDGMHVMYFGAALGDTLRGIYRSGNHFSEPWIAWRNDSVVLPDAFRMATAQSPFTVQLPSGMNPIEGGKPAIVQIMGTWCPNCKDEARLLESLHQKASGELQVIGLSFERTRDSVQAQRNIDRTIGYLELSYPVHYAGYADRQGVAKVLPQLEGFSAYPTTVFLYGDGKVAAVHTGFSGPATGQAYENTVEAYHGLVDELLRY